MMLLGIILATLGAFFMVFGVISVFIYRNIYLRILASATIDTVASLLFIFSMMAFQFEWEWILRFLLLMVFLMITSPISTHVVIRAAYLSKIPLKDDQR
jgi:multicomponent Na+:H+ antiporter subunit G